MTHTPQFSVFVPVYNRERLVKPTVDSVLAQTFADYELFVIDDGSTDGTLNVLRTYGDRIKLLEQTNQGTEAARSHAAALARGTYWVMLDSDDLLYPHALETYDRIIQAEDAPPVIIGPMRSFRDGEDPWGDDASDGRIEYVRFRDFISKDRSSGLSCSNVVIKGSVARSQGAFRKEYTAFPFDTADIMLLLGTSGPCVTITRPYTVAYRFHDTNTIRRLDYLLECAPRLARFERRGDYPGGRKRRFERYAYVGGVTWCYAAQGLRQRQYGRALKLLLTSFPMVAVGFLNTVLRRFRTPTPSRTLTP